MNYSFLKSTTWVSKIAKRVHRKTKLTSLTSHFCCAPTNVFLPLYWHSSSFAAPAAPCKHSSFWMLCLISWRVEYSKYYRKKKERWNLCWRPIFLKWINVFFLVTDYWCIFWLTWFPPSPWHGYKIRGFPPSLFSPASRHESLPTFFTYSEKKREGERKRSERKQDEKLTSSASCSNNFSLRSAFMGVKLEQHSTLWRP